MHKWIGLILIIIIGSQVVAADDNEPRVIYVAESKSLWSVASSVKPTEVRMWQAVLALYERNPDAFHDNDVNKLKDKVTLVVPSTEVMLSVTEAEAQVRFQSLGDQPQPSLKKFTLDASAKTLAAPKVERANNESVSVPNLVTQDKTLWSVARSVKPTEVRMWQAVLALYERNPGAFHDNDVNKLKDKVTLVVPSTEVMLSVTEAEAQVRFQFLGDQPQPSPKKFTLDASANTLAAPKVERANNESVSVPNLVTQDNTQESRGDKGQNINTLTHQNAALDLTIASTDLKANDSYFEAISIKPLNLNQEQAPASDTQTGNKKGAHVVLSSDAFANVRSSIGGAQLNELGDKIPTALTETAISKTENLINQQANEMANSVGHGKTQISLRQLATKTPDFSIRTIQPLTDLTDESTQLTFTQAQVSSGENHGERRVTINLGIGQRYLLENGQSIAGINLFTDYETESKHSRASLGLEYQRANFSANANQYYPLSNKVVIGDYTEEPLAGHDFRLTGQVPYLPWAKIKGTQYYWDAITGDNIKGTSLGIEANINAATSFEFGTENSNTASRSGYAQLRIQYPYNTTPTQFIIADKAFEDSNRLSLTDLNYVERSNKIRIEKLLNSVGLTLGAYNATTVGATCTLFNASHVAIPNGSGVTGSDGMVNLSNVVIPTGFVYSKCTGGYYIDEATGISTSAPDLRAGMIYSGTGNVILVPSPLSEIAYQLAGTNLASTIAAKNAEVATAFGLNSVDIISTIPTDINTTKAENDDAGKFATVLAAISQMGKNSDDANPEVTINALIADMQGTDGSAIGTIEGRLTGTKATGTEVDITKAIRNFATNSGANKDVGTGTGAANIDLSTGEGSVIGDLAIAFIDAYDGTNTKPTVLQYADAGVTGVTDDNLAAVNAAVANQPAGTTALIQALADTAITAASAAIAASDAVLAQIGTEANTAAPSVVTVAQINTISPAITAALAANETAYQVYIDANAASFASPATAAEVQAMVTAVNAAEVTSATVANSTLTASPATVAADGTASSTMTLQAKDGNGNNLSAGGLTVTMSESGSATLSGVTDNSNGTYTATITSTTAETVTVTATFGGSNVPDTADVSFTATAATVTNSTLTASTATVAADGVTTSTITMQAKDANNNNLSAGGLSVTMSESGSATLSGVTDNSNGTYTATITSTTAETVTVTAAIGGSNVTDTADVSFTPVVMTVDGQTYSTVEIGNQIWTASNVSIVPRDSNGPMNEGNPLSGSNSVWEGANGEPGEYYTHYWGSGGEAADEDGYYYTWAAAQNVCPTGWSLPSDDDWKALELELGVPAPYLNRGAGWYAQTTVAYTKLLAGGTSGFNAKLAGYPHRERGSYAYFWSSDQYIYRQLRASGEYVSRANGQHITHPRSVRCLKNN